MIDYWRLWGITIVSLAFIVFPDVSVVLRYISGGYIGGLIPYFLSFSDSGWSSLTPIGMLFGCLFCFIRWVAFSASRPEMLFTLDDGHLAALPRFLPGESYSRRVSATVYPPLGLSGGMFYAIKLIARRIRLV